jgi:hypothetical protein
VYFPTFVLSVDTAIDCTSDQRSESLSLNLFLIYVSP